MGDYAIGKGTRPGKEMDCGLNGEKGHHSGKNHSLDFSDPSRW